MITKERQKKGEKKSLKHIWMIQTRQSFVSNSERVIKRQFKAVNLRMWKKQQKN